jgi:hypothetical protein
MHTAVYLSHNERFRHSAALAAIVEPVKPYRLE